MVYSIMTSKTIKLRLRGRNLNDKKNFNYSCMKNHDLGHVEPYEGFSTV